MRLGLPAGTPVGEATTLIRSAKFKLLVKSSSYQGTKATARRALLEQNIAFLKQLPCERTEAWDNF
jgi:hypothetical protein